MTQAIIPGGMSAQDFLNVVQVMRDVRIGPYRAILLALARGERDSLWIRLVGKKRITKNQYLYWLRRRGWKIDTTTSIEQGTWRWIKSMDLSVKRPRPREVYKWTPLNTEGAYRFNPAFMLAFRSFLENYRSAGGVIVHRWGGERVNEPFKNLLKSLNLRQTYVRG